MSFFRALLRILFFIVCTSGHLSVIIIHRLLHGPNLDYALKMRKRCARRLVKVLGTRIRRGNMPPSPDGPCFFMGNHRSYYDPIVVLADVTTLPISKAEVAHWPLIGFAAKQTGILFVKRESTNSRKKTLLAMREKLQEGYSILLFPEGTTAPVGHELLPLRPGSFRLAAEMGIPIVPFVIEYKNPADAWIGNDTFIPHFFRCFGKRETEIFLSYGPPIHSKNPEDLKKKVATWIQENMPTTFPSPKED